MIWFFFISWQLIIKLIRNKSLFLWYSFTFNVVITHEIITFQDICFDEIPKYFKSIKDTYYAALKIHCFCVMIVTIVIVEAKILALIIWWQIKQVLRGKMNSQFLAHLSQRLKWAIVIAHRPSVVVNFHIFDFFSRTAWCILMKLGRDEVLMVPYKCCCFSARSAQGWI